MATVNTASYVRLADGSWGARCNTPIRPGDILTIRRTTGGFEKRIVKSVESTSTDGVAIVQLLADGVAIPPAVATNRRYDCSKPPIAVHSNRRSRIQCVCGAWINSGDKCCRCGE